MKNLLQGLLIAFSMYSRIPVPQVEWTGENRRYVLCFFPMIGAVVGAVLVLWDLFCAWRGVSGVLRGAGLAVLPVLITGGIHLDGLLDTADALAAWCTPEKRLEILKDSRAGAFAVITACVYFTLALGASTQMDHKALVLYAGVPVLSRSLSGLGVVCLKKARPDGTAKALSGEDRKMRVSVVLILWAAAAAAWLLAADLFRGAAVLAIAAACALYGKRTAYQKFGGVTGDLAGFFLQIFELCAALGVVLL